MEASKKLLLISTFLYFLGHSISSLIYPPFFNEEEVEHYRKGRSLDKRHDTTGHQGVSTGKPPCDEDKLMMNLAEIQVINPESIMKIAAIRDLDDMCRSVAHNLDKADKYLNSCIITNQKDLYIQLIKGVKSLHELLCKNDEFRKKFEQFHKCYKDLVHDLEDCNGPGDWNEESEARKVCTAYKEIVDCYYIKTAQTCGKEAAEVMEKVIKAVINSIITVRCDLSREPEVSDALPDAIVDSVYSTSKIPLHGPGNPLRSRGSSNIFQQSQMFISIAASLVILHS